MDTPPHDRINGRRGLCGIYPSPGCVVIKKNYEFNIADAKVLGSSVVRYCANDRDICHAYRYCCIRYKYKVRPDYLSPHSLWSVASSQSC